LATRRKLHGNKQPPAGVWSATGRQWLARQEKRRMQMNWDRVEGNWEQFKGKAQQQWGKLTNDDLDVIKGNRKELAGKIQERYGKAKDEAEREIDEWLSRH
jgi:uncharacterized protein YjbJ (UPF0337 family)